MSTLSSEVSVSFDCPEDQNGDKQIQRVPARSAQVGGGITVGRILPSSQRRMVGAWCFLDHAGPAVFTSGPGLRVGPHPHIGLQTFTWMIQGEVLHRDSLGHVQVIKPGQVNLMTAGRGISHTEESLPGEDKLHAVQLWIALPFKDAPSVSPLLIITPICRVGVKASATSPCWPVVMRGGRHPASCIRL